jgi:hypothetical protein
MLIKATCPCGNNDVLRFIDYDGSLGYGAVICKTCGRYSDMEGEHEADLWSQNLIARRS